jgi:protein required for attachment to host cells
MKIRNGTIVMAADGAKVLLFRNDGDEKYPILHTLGHHERVHPPSHEIGSDRPGRSFASADRRRSGYDETDWHQAEEDDYAQCASELLALAAKDSDADLVVIAPPRFLGILRKTIPRPVQRRVIAEIGRDLVRHPTDDIVEVIAAHRVENRA